MARVRQRRRCKAHRSDGEPCQAWAVTGAVVCRAHGGAARQVRRAADRERFEQAMHHAFNLAYARWRHEVEDWQVDRVLFAAAALGICPIEVSPAVIGWCVSEYGIPSEDTMPKLRVDRRYGPRTRRQLATRAARQAARKAPFEGQRPDHTNTMAKRTDGPSEPMSAGTRAP